MSISREHMKNKKSKRFMFILSWTTDIHTLTHVAEQDCEIDLHVISFCELLSDKAIYAHWQAESTDQCLLRNETVLQPYKYPQDMTVGHRRADRKLQARILHWFLKATVSGQRISLNFCKQKTNDQQLA